MHALSRTGTLFPVSSGSMHKSGSVDTRGARPPRERGWVGRTPVLWVGGLFVGVGLLTVGLRWRAQMDSLVQERARAVAAREVAEADARSARGERYAAHLQWAFEAFNQGARDSVADALGREVPRRGESDPRGWEWGFLSRRASVEPMPSGDTALRPVWAGSDVAVLTQLPPGALDASLLGEGGFALIRTTAALQVWELPSARLLHEIPSDPEALASAVSMGGGGKGAQVARYWVGGRVGVRLLVEDAPTVTVTEPQWNAVPRYSAAADLAFSQDGSRLAVADMANGVRVYQVDGMKALHRFEGVAARTVELNGDGRRMAAADPAGSVWIWDLSGAESAGKMWKREYGQVQSLAFSEDGRRVVTGGMDGVVRLLDANGGRELGVFGPVGAAVLGTALMDSRVAAGTVDGRVVFWDLASRRQVGTLRLGMGAVHSVRFLGRDGLEVATAAGVFVFPAGAVR